MEVNEIVQGANDYRKRPLLVACINGSGQTITCTVEQCAANNWRYLHIVADDLDGFLASALDCDRP